MSKLLYIMQTSSIKNLKNGGLVVNDRNLCLLQRVFEEVIVYNYEFNTENKIKVFLYSLLGINVGLTPLIKKNIYKTAFEKECTHIFLGTSRLGKLAKTFRKFNCITFFHNIEYIYIKKRIRNLSLVQQVLSLPMIWNVRYAEKIAQKYSNKIIVLNARDSMDLERLYGRKADIILPITFEDRYNEIKANRFDKKSERKIISFVGSDFFGNTEGLFWFIENCAKSINADLNIYGSGMDKYKFKYNISNVNFVGFIEDIDVAYYESDLIILPIFQGSGMKTKTCEALMYGKTIIGSSEAFEGYTKEIFENSACILCNSANDYIVTINNYLKNEISKINQHSRAIFLKYYETNKYETLLKEKLLYENC